MPDPRFFAAQGPFSLRDLAEAGGATIGPGADPDLRIRDVAPLAAAGSGDVSFLDNKRYLDSFVASRAGACIVDPRFADRAPQGMALLLSETPYKAYALIAQRFYPGPVAEADVAASADISPTASLGEGCSVGPGAVIGAGAEIGAHTTIGPNAVLGDRIRVGSACNIGACASLSHCIVGDRVVIHPGARIGQAGFGFAPDPDGHVKVPQLGRVIIEDDAEIGANTTIDRGSGPDTIIGAGTKIDNLVQIAHNVQVGRGCFVVAQVGISGSTKLGDHVALGGQAGLTGHLHVGSGAQIGAQAGVMRDVPEGATISGSPAVPIIQWHRQTVALSRLAKREEKDG